ncbi:MAG: hypothetical protein LBE76_05825 [Nitrososphaerota archaeon]|jgi:hypothetical protein|nr:hypothetical protein [Nitrososphaerota archaeon]
MKVKLKISEDFTIDDIHAIRRYNYEVTKGLSVQDRIRYYNEPDFRREVEARYLKQQYCIVAEMK